MATKHKQRNPKIVEAEEEFFNLGYITGHKEGRKEGVEAGKIQTVNFAVNFLENLEDVEGIGPKTAQKIRDKFLEKYGVKGDA